MKMKINYQRYNRGKSGDGAGNMYELHDGRRFRNSFSDDINSGNGYGSGSGRCDGIGCGFGDGNGSGTGYPSCHGYGFGYGTGTGFPDDSGIGYR